MQNRFAGARTVNWKEPQLARAITFICKRQVKKPNPAVVIRPKICYHVRSPETTPGRISDPPRALIKRKKVKLWLN